MPAPAERCRGLIGGKVDRAMVVGVYEPARHRPGAGRAEGSSCADEGLFEQVLKGALLLGGEGGQR